MPEVIMKSKQLFSIVIAAALAACTHAEVRRDTTGKREPPKQEKPVEGGKPAATPAEEFHAQGQADLDKALEELRNVSLFFEFDSSTLTKDAQDKLTAVAEV